MSVRSAEPGGPAPVGRRGPTRRTLLAGLLGGAAVGAVGAADRGVVRRRAALHAQTVALGATGEVVEVHDPARLVAGTRVIAGQTETDALVAGQQAWLAAGRLPMIAELAGSTMVRDAMLDLSVLRSTYGVPVAGWTPQWRYVWPRDSSMVAVAFARTGHSDEAAQILDFLAKVQGDDGPFQARYRPDGSGPPDGRGVQLDGLGWVLWATDHVVRSAPAAAQATLAERYRPMIDRSTESIVTLLDNRRALPPASADFWEVRERRTTLATAALFAAGLESAGQLYRLLGDRDRGADLQETGTTLTAAIQCTFGAAGYPRRAGGAADSIDLGASFLLPPFASLHQPGEWKADHRLLVDWHRSATAMRRPAGGLSPGGSWRQDGVSWTTSTSTYAMVAAATGERAEAVAWLRWLDEHRTAAGSLSEKVLADGSPASVAPLSWACAAVVIAATELS